MRDWTLDMFNWQGRLVLSGSRTLTRATFGYLSWNCKVSAFGQLIGEVDYTSHPKCQCGKATKTIHFKIVDGMGTPVLQIEIRHVNKKGEKASWNYPLMTMNGEEVGLITSYDSNTGEFPTGTKFSGDLDVKIKALLIYATIMIDFQILNVI